LGVAFEKAQGVTQNYSKALEWYRKAAGQGLGTAEFSLGNLYFRGLGVSRDYEQALFWYQKAVSHSYINAQSNIDFIKQILGKNSALTQ
jgi:TPR repeat protein